MNTALNVSDVVFYYNVKVLNNNRETVEYLSWQNLSWRIRRKYDWYFKYRTALLQVKYPKFEVQVYHGNEPATGKSLEEIIKLKIRGKKGKITEYKNKLDKYKKSWNSLFSIEDDDGYKLAIERIKKLESELSDLENKS